MSKRIIVYPKQSATSLLPALTSAPHLYNLRDIIESGRLFLADLSECGNYLYIPGQAEYPEIKNVPSNLFLKTDLPADGSRFRIYLNVKEGWDVKAPTTLAGNLFVGTWKSSLVSCSFKPGDETWEWSDSYFRNRDYVHPESNKYHVNFPKEMFSLQKTFNLREINPDSPLNTLNSYDIY